MLRFSNCSTSEKISILNSRGTNSAFESKITFNASFFFGEADSWHGS
jgi:hypothetical protein